MFGKSPKMHIFFVATGFFSTSLYPRELTCNIFTFLSVSSPSTGTQMTFTRAPQGGQPVTLSIQVFHRSSKELSLPRQSKIH